MKRFTFKFLGHAMAIISNCNKNNIIDPFFSCQFEWLNHTEKLITQLSEKKVNIEDIASIFISHIHSDHYDIETIRYFVNKFGSMLYTPAEIIEDAASKGIPSNYLCKVEKNSSVNIGGIDITCSELGTADLNIPRLNFFDQVIAPEPILVL